MERDSIDGATKPKGAIDMSNHKTDNHKCRACSKVGHTEKQCWKMHPNLMPEGLKKKQTNMATYFSTKKRELENPEGNNRHRCQFMAVTAMPQQPTLLRRSTRVKRRPITFATTNFKNGSPSSTISAATTLLAGNTISTFTPYISDPT